MITFNCPSCKLPFQTEDDKVGVLFSCPQCKSQLKVPTKAQASSNSAEATGRNSAGSTQKGKPNDPNPKEHPIEDRFRELFSKHGRDLCAETRRCESWIRDICGTKTKEAHLLISALKQQVPADLLGIPKGTSPGPILERLLKRLEDGLGLAETPARWAVQCWAIGLGIVSDADLPSAEISRVMPQRITPQTPSPSSGGFVELSEILCDPEKFDGQKVRLRGKYAGLYTGDSSFKIQQGDKEVWVLFSRLPKDQKSVILRRSEAAGKEVIAEGILTCGDGYPELTASSVSIQGIKAKALWPSTDGSLDLREILLDPASFDGQRVRLRGTYARVYPSDSSFTLEQGDHAVWVFFAGLPKSQKSNMIVEGWVVGKKVVAEGILSCAGGNPELTASNVEIEGINL